MLFFHGILTVFLLAILAYDITRYIIPNWITGILLGLYPVMLFMTDSLPDDFSIWWSLAAFLGVFVVGIGIFAMKWMGGGDIKLLAVLSLWAGVEALAGFLIYTGILGGGLALFLVAMRWMAARYVPVTKLESVPRCLRYDEPLPYGVAISVSFLLVLWSGDVPGMPVPW